MYETDSEPCYVISVVSRMVGMHAQTLRYYEKMGLVQPFRSSGRIRLYSVRDVERLRQAKALMDDMGVNLAGVEVILRLTEKMGQMEQEIRRLQSELDRLSPAKER